MNYTNSQFHVSQVVATNEAPRVIKKASTCIFVGAMFLYGSTAIPSHWTNKLGSMAIATGLVYVSCRLDKLESLLSPYQPTFSRLFKTKNNIYEKKHRETAKLDFVDQ